MINFLSTPVKRTLTNQEIPALAPLLNLIALQNNLKLSRPRELKIAMQVLENSINQN